MSDQTCDTQTEIPPEEVPEVITEDLEHAPQDPTVPTIFFCNFIPILLSEEKQKKLEIRIKVSHWQSWILDMCETLVLKKVNSKELPADDETQSQLKRALYRVRVLEACMAKSSAWTPGFLRDQISHETMTEEDLSSDASKLLADLGPEAADFVKMIRMIGPSMSSIAKKSQGAQSYWFMLVNYQYDTVVACFYPVIRIVSYNIKPATAKKEEGKFEVRVSINTRKFLVDLWEAAWEKLRQDDIVKKMEPLLTQKTLNFAVQL